MKLENIIPGTTLQKDGVNYIVSSINGNYIYALKLSSPNKVLPETILITSLSEYKVVINIGDGNPIMYENIEIN